MRYLIAGLGSIGRRHLRNLVTLGERDIVLLRTGRSTLPEDELAGFPAAGSIEEALEHKPQAVIVSNPTALHLDIALPAARAGCHLLIEKPVSSSMDRIADLVAAVAGSGSRVLVGYQFRFHPALLAVKDWLEQERIGRPYFARAHWGEYLPNWHPWEAFERSYAARRELGGGVVLTLSHPLDYLRWLFGPLSLRWAQAEARGAWDLDVDDSTDMVLAFEQGTAHIHLDYLQRPPEHTLEICASGGTILFNGLHGTAHLLLPENEAPIEAELSQGFERNDLFLAELKHFRDIITEDEEPRCSLQDGIETLELSIAALKYAPAGDPARDARNDD